MGQNRVVGTTEGKRAQLIEEINRMSPADISSLYHMLFGGRQPQDVDDDLWAIVTRSDPATIARILQDAQEDATGYKRLAAQAEKENVAMRKKLYTA